VVRGGWANTATGNEKDQHVPHTRDTGGAATRQQSAPSPLWDPSRLAGDQRGPARIDELITHATWNNHAAVQLPVSWDPRKLLESWDGRGTPSVIFDVDGTLADVRAYRHHVGVGPNATRVNGHVRKNFDAFHEESAAAPPHHAVAQAARDCVDAGIAPLVVTARKTRWRNHTAMWLALHDIPSEGMWMRPDTSGHADDQVKDAILARIQANGLTVLHAFDDNPRIVRLWASKRIPVTVVPGWEDS